MPEPLIDGMRDFSLEMQAGTPALYIPIPQRQEGMQSNNQRIYLDPGTYSIMMTFEGPRAATATIHRDIQGTSSWQPLLETPVGEHGESRVASTMITVSKQAAILTSLTQNPTQQMLDTGYSVGMVITRMGMPTV